MLRLNPNLPKVLSLVLPGIALIALIVTIERYQVAVAQAETAANLAYAAIEADRHASADAASLSRLQRHALQTLRAYAGSESAPEALATFLDHLQQLGKTYKVSIAGFDAAAPTTGTGDESAARKLKPQAFVLRLRGNFRNLLLFERRLSSDATLVEVNAIDFESAPAGGRRVTVSSTVHGRLFYLALAKDEL